MDKHLKNTAKQEENPRDGGEIDNNDTSLLHNDEELAEDVEETIGNIDKEFPLSGGETNPVDPSI